ncbi:uncharacterized protein LOC135393361 [Ornithodoros turicata]|uniref:uncharacterized protein LOC135393361 n=1 Tax=Ornithodoros turicata TaxID=34597 RepID=UPI00313A1ACF
MNCEVTITALLLVAAYGATVPTTAKVVVETHDALDAQELEDTVSKILSLVDRQLTLASETKRDDVTKEEKEELERQLENVKAELQATMKGHEEELGATLEAVSYILEDSNGDIDDESEYSKWKKLKEALTSETAKTIYKAAGTIALKVAIKSIIG